MNKWTRLLCRHILRLLGLNKKIRHYSLFTHLNIPLHMCRRRLVFAILNNSLSSTLWHTNFHLSFHFQPFSTLLHTFPVFYLFCGNPFILAQFSLWIPFCLLISEWFLCLLIYDFHSLFTSAVHQVQPLNLLERISSFFPQRRQTTFRFLPTCIDDVHWMTEVS